MRIIKQPDKQVVKFARIITCKQTTKSAIFQYDHNRKQL